MPIQLGGTLTDSKLLSWSIVHLQSWFYLAMGIVLIALEQEQSTGAFYTTTSKDELGFSSFSSRDYFRGTKSALTLHNMFAGLPSTSWHISVSAFAVHGFMFGAMAGYNMERRHWVWDVVGTTFGIHFVLTLLITGFPTNAWVWLTWLVDAVAAGVTAWYIAGRREMQEIPLQPIPDALPPAVSSSHNRTWSRTGSDGVPPPSPDLTASAAKRRAAESSV